MDSASQRRLSAHAAARHAEMLASGPPRYGALLTLCAVLCAVSAAVAAPFTLVGAAVLAAVAALLAAVRLEDQRSAWRYAPEPATPGRVLPPRSAAVVPPVIDLADRPAPTEPAEPAKPAVPALPRVLAVHQPTLPRAIGVVPQPRVAGAISGRALPAPRQAPAAERMSASAHPVP